MAKTRRYFHEIGTQVIVLGVLTLAANHLHGQTWTQLAPGGPLPGGRAAINATVLNSAGNRMIVFGGFLSGIGAYYNDTWVLTNANGLGGSPQWINVVPQGDPGSPAIRSDNSSVYDEANDRMIIFGGFLGGCYPPTNDLWVLSGASGLSGSPTWTQLFPSGTPPAARAYHTAVYDALTNRMIVFGGQNDCVSGKTIYSDVWLLTGANGLGGTPTWTELSPVGGPPDGQSVHTAVYDSANNRMTVFGGYSGPSTSNAVLQNAVWVLSNANGLGGAPVWTNSVPGGTLGSPSPRAFHTAVYDTSSNEMIVYGSREAPSELWRLSNANGLGGPSSWCQLAPGGGHPGVSDHGAVYDAVHKRMIVYGGFYPGLPLGSQTWVLDLTNVTTMCDQSAPVVSNILAVPDPVAINTSVALTAHIDDTTTGNSNIASAAYNINGGAFSPMSAIDGMFDEPAEDVSAAIPAFSATGVYNLCVTGTDSAHNTSAPYCIPLPVYDPSGGFVTGGGNIQSPAGADLVNPSAAGLATFGFVSKYLPGASTPSGNLTFQFRAGNLNFKSTTMDWLVVTGQPRAIFQGTGTVNGTNTCKFQVDAWDNSFSASKVDAFGIKIHSCGAGGDANGNRYSIDPTPLSGGSIIIHQ
jgi:galactose oxidase-like protein